MEGANGGFAKLQTVQRVQPVSLFGVRERRGLKGLYFLVVTSFRLRKELTY